MEALEQAWNRFRTRDQSRHLARKMVEEANLRNIEKRLHDRGGEVIHGDEIRRRFPAIARRLADDVAHVQPATREQQRRQFPPMIATRRTFA